MTLRFAHAGPKGDHDHLPDVTPAQQLRIWAESARNKGCDDPIFEYAYAGLLNDMGEAGESRRLYLKSADGLMNSRYPIMRALSSCWRQWSLNESDPAPRERKCT